MSKTYEVKGVTVFKVPSLNAGLTYARDPGEEASQTYKAGALLAIDGSSKELEETSASATGMIVGVAAKDATGTTGAAVPYMEANEETLFAMTLRNGSAAIALAASHLKVKYGVIKSGTDWVVDISNTTANQTKVVVVEPIDDIGDTNARVAVRFLSDKQQNTPASA